MLQASSLRVGFVQYAPLFGQVERNIQRVAGLVSRVEADLVVLPELFATGYLFTSRDELEEMAEEIPEGRTTRALAEISSLRGVWVVAGLAERFAGQLFNSAVLISPQGFVGVYRKIHLFDREKLWFTSGRWPFHVFEVKGVRIGMMVCFDWIFPESARSLTLKGAEIICHPANLVLPHCQDAMITRCLENRAFAITANRTGQEVRGGMKLTFTGRSQIVDPLGRVLVRSSRKGEEVHVVNIDPSRASDKLVTPRNHLIRDRQPALYAALEEG